MKRKFIVLGLSLVAVFSAWLVYSNVSQARRDAAYRMAIVPFQRDLPLGMNRADVQEYLNSRKVEYHAVRYGGSEAIAYQIKIGEEPGGLFCKNWTVYIALEFTALEKLREVHTRKIGTCL